MSFYTPDTVLCNGETFKLYISKEQIQTRIAEIGMQIDADYEGKKPIFIGVLNGSFIFLADLMRHVSIPCEVDFFKLSSYGDEKVSSGKVTKLKDLDAQIKGRHVIIVEDIVDTGLSMSYIMKQIKEAGPASVRIVTLLHKPGATKYDVTIDYIAFEIPTLFVLGYGLDYAQEGRNLAQIYVIDDSKDE
ncbi:MAG: hypoxanthine phosphoribosyltransferase [Balneolales bacterium]|nr:hypoxanthine phosphoribosyltransferase [Balneolales bacterium]